MDPKETTMTRPESGKSDWSFLKVLTDRNEPKIKFGEPKFTQYSYVDKKDGRKRIVVKCEIESELVAPKAALDDYDKEVRWMLAYPCGKKVKTVGKAICDERDEDKFSYTLGMRVSRVRAEKRAFERHSLALKARMTRLLDFYHNSLNNFIAKAEKVAADEIIWGGKKKK